MNIGHQLLPSFFAHQSSSSDSEEIAKAHDIKTDGFIALFPVVTMDVLGIILLATGSSLLLFSFSFIVPKGTYDGYSCVSTIVLSSFHQFRPVRKGGYDLLRTGCRKAKIVYDLF
jgi:hypothetical protein